AALDAAIMAAGVKKKPTLPEREAKPQPEGRGRSRRAGDKPFGTKGQPHRARKAQRDRTHHGERGQPARPSFDPLAQERPEAVAAAAKGGAGATFKRRRRRPSNGGKGYGAQA